MSLDNTEAGSPRNDSKPTEGPSTQLEAVLGRALNQTLQAAPDPNVQNRFDYQITIDLIKLYSDIRFRCLAFVTASVGLANALAPGTVDPGSRAALGIVGFIATLGIAVYELRNSSIYEAACHRAIVLEVLLKMARTADHTQRGGLFNEKPQYVSKKLREQLKKHNDYKNTESDAVMRGEPKPNNPEPEKAKLMTFMRLPVKHDTGLALIYGAAFGGWAYMIAAGVLAIPPLDANWPSLPARWLPVVAGSIGLGVFGLTSRLMAWHDEDRLKPDVTSVITPQVGRRESQS